jgi:catechol 2,3-dioxygenase-like lactoylglutathione lyase family enzyme
MSLHGLLSVTMGVPNVAQTAAYYADFGLAPEADGWFSTQDAGRQLQILPAPTRRLLGLRVGVDDADDLAPAGASLGSLGVLAEFGGTQLEATEDLAAMMTGAHSAR